MDTEIKNGLISGGMWVFSGRVLSLFSQLLLNAIIARLLSPENVGLYFLIYSLVHFFMMFSLLGMQRSIVKIISESLALGMKSRATQAVRYMLGIGLLTSVFLAVLLCVGAGQFIAVNIFKSFLMSKMLYLPSVWLIVFTLQTLVAEAFRGYHNIRDATLFNGLVSSFICVPILGFLLLSQQDIGLQTILTIIITAYTINLIFALILLRRHTERSSQADRSEFTAIGLLRRSWLLYFQNLILFIMTSGQMWLLAYFSTKENVATYGAVFRLMVIVTTSLAMLRLTILPTIGHLYAKGRYAEVERILKIAASIAGLPAFFGLLTIIVMGKYILFIVYGSHYVAGYSALTVLALAHLVNVLTGMPGPLLVMASKEKALFLITLAACLLGLSLSCFLVGRLDFLGVSIGAATGIVSHNVLMAFYCTKKLSINTWMSYSEVVKLVSTILKKISPAVHPR